MPSRWVCPAASKSLHPINSGQQPPMHCCMLHAGWLCTACCAQRRLRHHELPQACAQLHAALPGVVPPAGRQQATSSAEMEASRDLAPPSSLSSTCMAGCMGAAQLPARCMASRFCSSILHSPCTAQQRAGVPVNQLCKSMHILQVHRNAFHAASETGSLLISCDP
jgi:hypothetical protein